MLTKTMLKQAYQWGWIDEGYLAHLVGLGKLTESELDMITGKNVISITKQKTPDKSSAFGYGGNC